jgi:two-component system phosphate regulon response regulator PhoB
MSGSQISVAAVTNQLGVPPVHRRVLVAEDEPDLRVLLQEHLAQQGYEVLLAEDGVRAMQMIHESRPDLIILDYAMPRMTGYQVLAELHQHPELAGVPVIILTGAAGPLPMEFASVHGARRYVTKPFDLAELDQHIQAVLRETP